MERDHGRQAASSDLLQELNEQDEAYREQRGLGAAQPSAAEEREEGVQEHVKWTIITLVSWERKRFLFNCYEWDALGTRQQIGGLFLEGASYSYLASNSTVLPPIPAHPLARRDGVGECGLLPTCCEPGRLHTIWSNQHCDKPPLSQWICFVCLLSVQEIHWPLLRTKRLTI